MTIRHVLLVCPSWQDIRQEIGFERDIRCADDKGSVASNQSHTKDRPAGAIPARCRRNAGCAGATRTGDGGGGRGIGGASDRGSFCEGTFTSRWNQHIDSMRPAHRERLPRPITLGSRLG